MYLCEQSSNLFCRLSHSYEKRLIGQLPLRVPRLCECVHFMDFTMGDVAFFSGYVNYRSATLSFITLCPL